MKKEQTIKVSTLKEYRKYLLAILLFFDDFCKKWELNSLLKVKCEF